jgi:hypothetical protein
VLQGDVVDQLHDQHGLPDPGATEEAGLAALHVRLDEIHHLDAGLEHLDLGGLLLVGGGQPVDGQCRLGLHGAEAVHGVAQNVDHPAQRRVTHRDGDRSLQIDHLQAALQSLGGLHGHGPHAALSQVLGHLGGDGARLATGSGLHPDRIQDGGEVPALEGDIDHRADDLDDFSLGSHSGSP